MVKDIQGWQYIAFAWAMVAVTFICVLMRLYVRVYLQVHVRNTASWVLSEVFVILGWLLFLGIAICDSVTVHAGGKNMNPNFKMTPEQEVRFLKAQFAWSWMFKPSIYMMKYALLFFYVELIQKVQHKKIWWAIVVTAVFNTIGLIGQWLFIALQCVPASKQWTIGDNDCANITAYPAFTWGMHVLTDVMVFILPFLLLRTSLRAGARSHSVGEWSGAVVMFSLGIINVLSAIACMALRLQPENYHDTPRTVLGQVITFLFTVQIATGIAIPCCPQIRVFIKFLTGHYEKDKRGLSRPSGYAQSGSKEFSNRGVMGGSRMSRMSRTSKVAVSGSEPSGTITKPVPMVVLKEVQFTATSQERLTSSHDDGEAV